jgi:hypothetical protein
VIAIQPAHGDVLTVTLQFSSHTAARHWLQGDEAVGRSKDVYRGSVELARLSTRVGQDAESRKLACEQAGDPVGNSEIECCYSPFGERDQEDRNFKDCQN